MSHRRDFLKTTAGLAAAASVPYVFTTRATRADGPNDRLTVASIGVGGRGSGIGHQAGSKGNMVACCDVDSSHAERFAEKYEGRCEIFGDYRHILDRDDVEVVTIGTPDHWHVKIAVEAMQSGKDVYCEKPLTLTVDEGKTICRVVEETGRVLQVGTQQRSEFNSMFLKAVVLAQSGRLGENLTARCQAGNGQSGGPFPTTSPPAHLDWDMWLGQAPAVEYCPERVHHNFRWWLEYSGGQITDWGVHVADIGLWALGVDKTGPTEVEGTGTFASAPNAYNAASQFDTTMTFANGRKLFLTSEGGGNTLVEGEKGRILVNRGRFGRQTDRRPHAGRPRLARRRSDKALPRQKARRSHA